ncbi:MAG TPA: hypothetical protein VF832_02135 [Longimicrobiales bacterium]
MGAARPPRARGDDAHLAAPHAWNAATHLLQVPFEQGKAIELVVTF